MWRGGIGKFNGKFLKLETSSAGRPAENQCRKPLRMITWRSQPVRPPF